MEPQKIIILGNSPAGTELVASLRERQPDWEIGLFTLDGQFPYIHSQLPAFLGREIDLAQVYCQPPEYYQRLGVRISHQPVDRINLNKCRVITADKKNFPFDYLIIAGAAREEWPKIKGTHRQGVFNLRRLGDIIPAREALALSDTVVIQDQGPLGLRTALKLAGLKKEVLFVTGREDIAPGGIDADSLKLWEEMSAGPYLRFLPQNGVAEVLGDNDVRAVRLKSGKVFAGQMVLLGDGTPDLRIFKDTGLKLDERIPVNENHLTNLPNVFAAGDIARPPSDTGPEDQGRAIASTIREKYSLALPK